MTKKQIQRTIDFFRNAGFNAREQEGEVWVTVGVGHTTVIIEKAAVVCPFPQVTTP